MIHVSFFAKNTLAVGIAALFMTNATAQTVVDYPGSQNHENYIEVYRTATDQEQTVFDVTVYNRPGYWIQLSSAGVLDGKQVSVNGLIKGKWALVDLWASWCGPCRKNSKQMIPVYQKYADKGFTVVGIAREQNVSDALEAIRKDGYPWVQLIDLRDEFCIWLRHGTENAGGSTFLVNPEGKIVAIHPSAEEVEAILEQHLGY